MILNRLFCNEPLTAVQFDVVPLDKGRPQTAEHPVRSLGSAPAACGLFILGVLLCCILGCISKANTTSSHSTVSGPSSIDSPSTEVQPPALELEDSLVARTSQTQAILSAPDDVGQVEVISFDDLNLGLEADVRFRDFMLRDKRAQDLIEKRVNIAGYISPTDRMTNITDFILLRNLECKFGPGGKADHLVHVFMNEGAGAEFTDKVVYVEGTLKLKPFHSEDGSATWSIYDLHGDGVSTTPPPRQR